MTGRDRAETRGYLPSYLALARRAGDAELLGHLGPGVDHLGLDRPGGQGPVPDGLPVLAAGLGRLADVDGDRDDLDPLVLDQPPDGHRRVQPSAVGQYHPLRHDLLLVVVEPSAGAAPRSTSLFDGWASSGVEPGHRRPAGRPRCAPPTPRRHHQHGVVAGHRADHPGEAAAVEGRADDVGRTRRGAQDDQVARVVGLDHPLAQHPAEVVLGGHLLGRAARAGRRPSPRRAGAPSPPPAPRGPATPSSGWPRSPRRPAARPAGPGCPRPRSRAAW